MTQNKPYTATVTRYPHILIAGPETFATYAEAEAWADKAADDSGYTAIAIVISYPADLDPELKNQ